ncbi:uncharacterized membrane protein YsdA (DUF1294 family) [Confluentimicrobium naphthalenivorans]|uniref:Uncharacterized membrane protein YsdA (DUF1294 family) n=1 Tax=Actibacterium naphthalenivorans TaxID=1614693 RepID=A0A840C8P2_9RHOB|nr:uncharacterized membrane protein YsdA (DUF1294 family) [Actibacterium naphthalenivorans]
MGPAAFTFAVIALSGLAAIAIYSSSGRAASRPGRRTGERVLVRAALWRGGRGVLKRPLAGLPAAGGRNVLFGGAKA